MAGINLYDYKYIYFIIMFPSNVLYFDNINKYNQIMYTQGNL